MPTAILNNFLWVKKQDVKGSPSDFAPDFEHKIKLLSVSEGKIAQQQIAVMREQAIQDGEDPDDVVKALTENDYITIRSWGQTKDWWTLCTGDKKKLQRLIDSLKLTVKDKRTEVPWPEDLSGLKMVLPPRPNQPPAFQQWYDAGYGILKASPAFGKSYIMIWNILTRRQRTLFLVHTDVLAAQFITRFRDGSPQEDGSFLPITNCKDVETATGQTIISRLRDLDDLAPVTVATWQTFSSEAGRRLLKVLSKSFGQIICDEAHVFGAPAPSSIVNSFHARWKMSVSATPSRKDQLHCALFGTVGPVTAVGDANQLPITSFMIATGTKYTPSRYPSKAEWSRLLSFLVKDDDRNDLIFDWLKTDVVSGRNVLVICDRVNWCLEMAVRLTKAGVPARAVIGGLSSKKSLADRDKTIADMGAGTVRVICATSTFKAGVDIPCLDTLYLVLPMNNLEQLEQTLGRVRRIYEDKQSPVLRYFVDEGHGLLYGCARGTHKYLKQLDSEIVFVEQGKTPRQVILGEGAYFKTSTSRPSDIALALPTSQSPIKTSKGGLKGIANKVPNAVQTLFSDLQDEVRQGSKYRKRQET